MKESNEQPLRRVFGQRPIENENMRNYLFLLFLAAFFTGCTEQNADLEQKRQYAIQDVKDTYLRSKSPLQRRWGADCLPVLASATINSLKEPKCTSATLAEYPNLLFKLAVFWIESKPSVTSVEFHYGKTNPPVGLPLSDVDKRENRRASQTTVLLAGVFALDSGMVRNAETIGDLKARLLQSNVPVTDWFPVALYKAMKQLDGKYQAQPVMINSNQSASGRSP